MPIARRTPKAIRRFAASVFAALIVLLGATGARACVNVTGWFADVGTGGAPAVCENIWWNGLTGAGAAYDYQFFVALTGGGSIDFFGFGVGAAPAAVTSTNGGTTVFPNANVTGVLPVSGQSNGIFNSANTPPAGWDFDEYTQAGGYFVDWNDQGPGTLPGAAALNVLNNAGSIASSAVAFGGAFGVFNAFSPFGPVAGFGVVDPPATPDIFEIGLGTAGGTEDLLEITNTNPGGQQGPSTLCTQSYACADPNGKGLADPIPEPASAGLLAAALLGLGAARLRRR